MGYYSKRMIFYRCVVGFSGLSDMEVVGGQLRVEPEVGVGDRGEESLIECFFPGEVVGCGEANGESAQFGCRGISCA